MIRAASILRVSLRGACSLRCFCSKPTGFLPLLPGKPHFAGKLHPLGIVQPSPIQQSAIPALLSGKGSDVAIQAVTGSGKTLAYLLPLMANIDTSVPKLQLVVVSPTRELAVQVYGIAKKLSSGSKKNKRQIRVVRAVGSAQSNRLDHMEEANPHMVIGTPSTVNALIGSESMHLGNVRALVLDEADVAVEEESIRAAVKKTVKALSGRTSRSNASHSRVVFVSATITDAVYTFSKEVGRQAPELISAGAQHDNDDFRRYDMPDTLRHLVLPTVLPNPHSAAGSELTAKRLAELYSALKPTGVMLVFAKNESIVPAVLEELRSMSLRCTALTAHYPKERKARAATLKNIKNGKIQVLLSTEMGARGLDFGGVGAVVNLTPPRMRQYIHRAGRAARMAPLKGPIGEAISQGAAPVAECGVCVTFVPQTNNGVEEAEDYGQKMEQLSQRLSAQFEWHQLSEGKLEPIEPLL